MTVSMEKRKEQALVSLQKMAEKTPTDLGDVCAQVGAAIDFSYSMADLYENGKVQEAVERALALSLTGLDDDGVVPIHFFDSKSYPKILATEKNYEGLVRDFLSSHHMGGTNYSQVIRDLLQVDQNTEKDEPPHLNLFFTDGEPSETDKPIIEDLLVQARTRPHFFQFIMLGTSSAALRYLEHLNNELTGPGVDNVGVTVYNNPAQVADEQFFDDIVSEFFPDWLPEARKQGITNK